MKKDTIKDYLDLIKQNNLLEKKIATLREVIIKQARKKNTYDFSSGGKIVSIIERSETVFPEIGESGREEVESVVKRSTIISMMMSFDIVKLGNAYDEKNLPPSLITKLKPYAKKVVTTRVVIKKSSRGS